MFTMNRVELKTHFLFFFFFFLLLLLLLFSLSSFSRSLNKNKKLICKLFHSVLLDIHIKD